MKSQRSKTIDRLDTIFSHYIRKRDCVQGFGRCCSCTKLVVSYMDGDAGHFINRRHMATRWREDNVHLQCRSCNRFNEGNGPGYTLFMIDRYGRKHVEYLQALSRETAKFTIPEMELMIKDYRQKVKEL